MGNNKIFLNREQKKAVEYNEGPLLLVAGAGTGKTRVITERIKWLLTHKKVQPFRILALTFTGKAANEILERIDEAMPLGYEEPWLSTFHAFADRILRDEGLAIGLDPSYKILTPSQAWLLIRQNLFAFELNYYRPLGNPTKFISALLTLFSRAQDEDTTPADFVRWAKLQAQNSKLKTDEEKEITGKYLELANAYQTYQDLKIANSYLDFGDLISWALKLFRQRPAILKKYREQFHYILLDEFQDTNYAQYQLLKLLAPPEKKPKLLVCGDDDQAIYRFRGAAVSNVLQFKKDYPQAETIVLTKNYRSGQKILDAAYRLIQNNNPERLEEKLQIVKKLKSQKGAQVEPEIIVATTAEVEAEQVVKKIVELKKTGFDWKDFAILARANNHLEAFVAALKRHGIPYQRIGNRGLFDQEEVRDVIAILRVLADPEDNISLYRLLNLSTLKIDPQQIADLLSGARRTRQSLWNTLKGADSSLIASVPIDKYRQQIAKKSVTQIIFDFLNEIDYLTPLVAEDSLENQLKIRNLNLFLEKVKVFESGASEPNLIEFVEYLDLLLEAGESPAQAEIEDVDTVNLLTVHAAKGLEFPVVFLVNLTTDRFPTRNRKDPIPLPEALIKEILPEGNSHLQEERRLFYVGCTRAQERLFLSRATDYGGVQKKRPSPFIAELELKDYKLEVEENPAARLTVPTFKKITRVRGEKTATMDLKYVSHSQLETFTRCPRQYYYRYILGLPEPPNHTLSFGQTIHRTLRDFHRHEPSSGAGSLARLLNLYERHWIPEGYQSKEHQEKQFAEGKEMLKNYFDQGRKILGQPLHLEKKFTLKIGKVSLIGSIDRIDKRQEGRIEIVDYKTGKFKGQQEVDKDDQLTIYALAAQEALGLAPRSLCLFFVAENKRVATTRTTKQLQQKKEEIATTIEEIKKADFAAKTAFHCRSCPFRSICPAFPQRRQK